MTQGHLAKPVTRTCKGCPEVFETTVARRLYCTPKCSARATESRRVRATVERTCAWTPCGRKFAARTGRATRYCGYACAAHAKHAAGLFPATPSGAESPNWRGGAHASRVRRIYGVEYEALLARQGGVCGICGETPGARRLAVDHDHATGEVRGLLCSDCNLGLGLLGDTRETLLAAVAYLSPVCV